MSAPNSRRWLPLLTFLAAQAALWAVLGFAFAALLVLASTRNNQPSILWTEALRISAVNWLPWAVLTPLIFWLAKIFPLERGRLLRSVPVHLVAGLACSALCLWLASNAFPLLRPSGGPQGPRALSRDFRGDTTGPRRPDQPPGNTTPTNRSTPGGEIPPRTFPENRFGPDGPGGGFGRGPGGPGGPGESGMIFRGPGDPGGPGDRGLIFRGGPGPEPSFLNELRRDFFGAFGPFALRGNFGVAIYLIVLSAAHALGYYRRAKERDLHAAELAANLTRAKLDALRLQLQPHFLFNTLNAIATLVHRDAHAADELIGDLSDLLRLSLLTTDHEVPLARELELLDRYLAIEQTRLGPRLRIAREVDAAATAALVPTFVLQPLAENAIRHGLEPRSAPGTLTVSARRDGDMIRLTVADDGVGLAADQLTSRRGIGLANTEARLQALHGAAAKLELHTPPEGGLRVELTIPFRTKPETANQRE